MKVSAVISAGGSFCCNYAIDLCIYGNYASDKFCCILAGFQGLLSVTVMLVGLSVTIMQVNISVTVMQLEASAGNMWVAIFIVIMQMGVSDTMMQVVFSAMHYAHGSVYCNYTGDFPF